MTRFRTTPTRVALGIMAISLLGLAALAQTNERAQRYTPDELFWNESPNGTARATLMGSPEAAGLYAYRARFPGNFRNEPHAHPDDRIVTVIAGTLHVGYGERFDEHALKVMPAGSVWTEPAGQAHFVYAPEPGVVIQVVGIGPSATIPVAGTP